MRSLIALLLVLPFTLWAAPQPIRFWHSFSGQLGEELKQQVELFNHSQQETVIIPQYKGDYIEALSSYAAARHAHKAPAMVQVFEVGSALMQKTPGLIEPVDPLMADFGYSRPSERLLPGVASFYTQKGVLQALPLNVSLPVLYYNRDALASLGVNDKNFPKTWSGFETLLKKLKNAGHSCAYTTAYPAWIHVETFSAMHRLPFVDKTGAYAITQAPALIAHWERLARWQRQGLFVYGGRNSDATVLFSSGRCVLFSQSSGSLASLQDMVPFRVGVAGIPYDAQWVKDPAPPSFGGAALWVTAGQPETVRRGIAQFLEFLSEPEQQYRWYKRTGYLPMGDPALYQNLIASEPASPLLNLAWEAFQKAAPQQPLLPQNQIRTVLEQSLEAVFSNQQTVPASLNTARKAIQYRLHRFRRNIG